jgi:hypothetical protein
MNFNELMKCSRRGCGWIGTLAQQRQHRIAPGETEGRCPRCNCNSFYNTKPGELPSDAVLPHSIASAKFVMICTGESYSTKIVDGGKLHEEWAAAIFGKLEDCPAEQLADTIQSMKDMDNWQQDHNGHGPTCWEEDVGETDHITFWRLT